MADDNTEIPDKFEIGTIAMEHAAGAAAAVEFIADIGRMHEEYFTDELEGLTGRRRLVVAGIKAIEAYEEPLARKLRDELSAIEGVTVYSPPEDVPKTSTVSFTVEGIKSAEFGTYLVDSVFFFWYCHFYAMHLINNVLDLKDQGGVVRIGLAPYNTADEVDRTIQAVKDFIYNNWRGNPLL